MPYTSADISGMVGGQMAMFSNQASFAQQIGGQIGTGRGGGGNPFAPMSNPYPSGDVGSRVAGGAAMALPGIATGVSLAGGLMGGKMGWLDPMTGVARGFARGAGAGGAGFTSTLGHVGRAFTAGGLRGGLGVMAGGMAGAAAMALPYYLAGKAIDTVAGNIYQGAQNISEVGNMAAQHFGPQYGAAGARDGKMARSTIKQITGVLHEIVGDDTRATMDDVKKLMDQAGQMGMLTGITDAQQFKTRFSKIVKQVRAIADVMGTSLGEAGQMMGQMRQMGLWTTRDIMGTVMQGRVAGAESRQMVGAMQQGAQISHAMGGTLRAGAMMGQQNFATIQAAQRAGVLSEEDIMEFTGGVGGGQGKQMMAGRMSQLMSQFGRTAAGRLAMAGLGETREGRFTGEINQERLQKFMGGQISLRQLEAMGRKQTQGRQGQMSFERFDEKLAQNLSSSGGIEAFTQLTQEVAKTHFGGSEDARQLLLQQMLGLSDRESELIGRLRDQLPRIRDQQMRAQRDAVMQAFRDLDERQNRSWAGVMDSIKHSWGEAVRPLQEFGESLSTSIGEATDDAVDKIYGRVRRIPMGAKERVRLLQQGALSTNANALLQQQGLKPMGQSWVDEGGSLQAKLRNPDFMRYVGAGAAGGAAVGAGVGVFAAGIGAAPGAAVGAIGGGVGAGIGYLINPQNTRVKALRDIGLRTGEGEIKLGDTGLRTTQADIQTAREHAYARAQGKTMIQLDSNEKKDAMAKVQAALRDITSDKDQLRQLKKLKEEDPQGYQRALASRLRGMVGKEMDLLGGGKEGLGGVGDLDVLSDAQNKMGWGGGEYDADFTKIDSSLGVPAVFGDTQSIAEAQKKALSLMESSAGHQSAFDEIAGGAAFGAMVGLALPIPGGALLMGAVGAGAGLISHATRAEGPSRADFEKVMTGEHASVVQKFLAAKPSEENTKKFLAYVAEKERGEGGGALRRVADQITQNMDASQRKQMAEGVELFSQARMAEVGVEARGQIRGIAQRAAGAGQIGLAGRTGRAYNEILGLLKGGKTKPGELDDEEYREANKKMDELAKDIRGDKETRAKMRAAGGFAGQVATLADVEDIGAMKAGRTKKWLQGFQKTSGMNIEDMEGPQAKRLRELLAGGVKKGEVGEVKALLSSLTKTMITETQQGMKSVQQQLLDQLKMFGGESTKFAEANTRFVGAVDRALGKENIDLKQAAAEATAAGGSVDFEE